MPRENRFLKDLANYIFPDEGGEVRVASPKKFETFLDEKFGEFDALQSGRQEGFVEGLSAATETQPQAFPLTPVARPEPSPVGLAPPSDIITQPDLQMTLPEPAFGDLGRKFSQSLTDRPREELLAVTNAALARLPRERLDALRRWGESIQGELNAQGFPNTPENLIGHEVLEKTLMADGIGFNDAHDQATRVFGSGVDVQGREFARIEQSLIAILGGLPKEGMFPAPERIGGFAEGVEAATGMQAAERAEEETEKLSILQDFEARGITPVDWSLEGLRRRQQAMNQREILGRELQEQAQQQAEEAQLQRIFEEQQNVADLAALAETDPAEAAKLTALRQLQEQGRTPVDPSLEGLRRRQQAFSDEALNQAREIDQQNRRNEFFSRTLPFVAGAAFPLESLASFAGEIAGGEIGSAVGGETGERIGSIVGSVAGAAPVAVKQVRSGVTGFGRQLQPGIGRTGIGSARPGAAFRGQPLAGGLEGPVELLAGAAGRGVRAPGAAAGAVRQGARQAGRQVAEASLRQADELFPRSTAFAAGAGADEPGFLARLTDDLTALDAQIAARQEEARAIERPPWARNMTVDEIMRVADQEGVNPFGSPDWADSIDPVVIREARQGRYRTTTPTIPELRSEAAVLRRQVDDLRRAQPAEPPAAAAETPPPPAAAAPGPGRELQQTLEGGVVPTRATEASDRFLVQGEAAHREAVRALASPPGESYGARIARMAPEGGPLDRPRPPQVQQAIDAGGGVRLEDFEYRPGVPATRERITDARHAAQNELGLDPFMAASSPGTPALARRLSNHLRQLQTEGLENLGDLGDELVEQIAQILPDAVDVSDAAPLGRVADDLMSAAERATVRAQERIAFLDDLVGQAEEAAIQRSQAPPPPAAAAPGPGRLAEIERLEREVFDLRRRDRDLQLRRLKAEVALEGAAQRPPVAELPPAGTPSQPALPAARTAREALEADVSAARAGGLPPAGGIPEDVTLPPFRGGGLPDLTDFSEQFEVTFRSNNARAVGEALAPVVRFADPSVAARRPGQRAAVVFANLIDEGGQRANNAFTYAAEMGNREQLLGRLDPQGRFIEGPFAGRSLNEVAESPALLRQLQPNQREYVDRLRQLDQAATDLMIRVGRDINKLPETERLLFAGRNVMAKLTPDGQVIAVKQAPDLGPRGRRLGGRVSAEAQRRVETAEELRKRGFVLLPFDQQVQLKLRTAYRAQAEDSLVKWVEQNFNVEQATSRFEDATKLPFQSRSVVVRGAEGQQLALDLERALTDLEFRPGATRRALTGVNSVNRFFALAADASLFGLQLLIAAFGRKRAAAIAFKRFAAQLGRATISPENARANQAQRIQRSAELVDRHPRLILGGTEFTEVFDTTALSATDLWESALSVRGAVQRVKAIPRRILEPFQIAFESAMDEAGITIAEALEPLGGGDLARLQDIDDYVNNIRGVTSSARLGVPASQRVNESILLLAARYRRATAAFYVSMAQGGLRGELARDSMLKFLGGMATLGFALTIAKGVQDGKSRQEIMKDVAERIDPTSPRFMLWEIAGQQVGPGSKIVSDMRLISMIATDPEGFIDTSEFRDNNFVRYLSGQGAFAATAPLDIITNRNFIGEPVGEGGALDLTRDVLSQNFVMIWIQSALFEGQPDEGIQAKAARGAADFVGFRAFPSGAFDYLDKGTRTIYPGQGYRDLELYQKDRVRDEQAELLRPITEQRAQGGEKLSVYFLEQDNIDTALDTALQNIVDAMRGQGPIAEALGRRMSNFEAKNAYYSQTAAARNQKDGLSAGLQIDFNEQKDGESDENLQALEAYYETFGAATVGNVFLSEIWTGLLDDLFSGLSASQKSYVERNTNLRAVPPEILRLLSAKSRKRIENSEAARKRHSGQRQRERQQPGTDITGRTDRAGVPQPLPRRPGSGWWQDIPGLQELMEAMR